MDWELAEGLGISDAEGDGSTKVAFGQLLSSGSFGLLGSHFIKDLLEGGDSREN